MDEFNRLAGYRESGMRPRFQVLSDHEGQRGVSIGYSRECIIHGVWPIAESADCLVYLSYELFRRIVRTEVRPNMASALNGREEARQLIFRRVFEVQIGNLGHWFVRVLGASRFQVVAVILLQIMRQSASGQKEPFGI